MGTLQLPGAALKQSQPSWFPRILALLLCKHHHLSAAPGSRRVPNPRGHRDNDFGARWETLFIYSSILDHHRLNPRSCTLAPSPGTRRPRRPRATPPPPTAAASCAAGSRGTRPPWPPGARAWASPSPGGPSTSTTRSSGKCSGRVLVSGEERKESLVLAILSFLV